MRDEITITRERPAVLAHRNALAETIPGTYAIEQAPLNSGAHYRTIRIEAASPDVKGRLVYINARTVEIDGNGTVVSQSDRVRLLGFPPRLYFANPLSARARCERANELTDRMIEIGRTLSGAAWREHREHYEALIAEALGRAA